MRVRRAFASKSASVAAAAVGAVALNASPAGAAVTIGETFVPNAGCQLAPQTFIGAVSPASPAVQYSAPSPGVITSWSFQAPAVAPTQMRFHVARAATPPNFTAVGRGEIEVPVASQLNTFATRVPVRAGDLIGFFSAGAMAGYACARAAAGYEIWAVLTDPDPGTTGPYNPNLNVELDVSAQLEPDADADGFGDETQDLCPTDADTVKACRDKLAPETTMTKKPKKKEKKKKATFEFASSEAGSTFRCSLDGSAFEPCTSPKTYKVKPARHTFTVLAKDAAGNVDDTPATVSWTSTKKKK